MTGLTGRIRELVRREIPALQQVILEADRVIRDLEDGIEDTPVGPERVATPAGPVNRGPLSPIPAPARRRWDTLGLRRAWSPVVDEMLAHLERERTMVYPLAVAIFEGRMDQRRNLATPIVQMVDEHERIRALFPALRSAALACDPVAPQVIRALQAFERHTRIEEVELFPALLQLADGSFDVTATPLMARYRTGSAVTRSLRRAVPRQLEQGRFERFLDWVRNGGSGRR